MIKLAGLIKKKEHLSSDEFEKYWLEVHTKIAEKLPGLIKYSINLTLDNEDKKYPYDGFSELWFESEESLKKALDSEIFKTIYEDCKFFQSHIDRLYVKEIIIKE